MTGGRDSAGKIQEVKQKVPTQTISSLEPLGLRRKRAERRTGFFYKLVYKDLLVKTKLQRERVYHSFPRSPLYYHSISARKTGPGMLIKEGSCVKNLITGKPQSSVVSRLLSASNLNQIS